MALNLGERDSSSFLKRLTTPDNIAPNTYQKLDFGAPPRLNKTREGQRDNSTELVDSSYLIAKQAEEKKPPFNV